MRGTANNSIQNTVASRGPYAAAKTQCRVVEINSRLDSLMLLTCPFADTAYMNASMNQRNLSSDRRSKRWIVA